MYVRRTVSSVNYRDLYHRYHRHVALYCIYQTVLIKNTVFGIAVFETYERIIKYEATKIEPRQLTSRETDVNRSNSSCSEGQSPSSVKIFVNDSYAIAPIRSHFIAGTAAGSVHAVLSYTTDSLAIRSMPTWPFMGRQLLHHSLAHSIMFGTYEWSKRNMLNVFRVEASLEPTPILENEPSVQSVGIAISGAAGGIAGILQNTISHYTSLWLRIDCSENQPSGILTLSTKQTTSTWEKALRLLNQFPPMRQTMVAFPSMAIAFIAFEYGKDFSQAAV